MKIAIAALLAGTAAAFAPSVSKTRSTALKATYENEIGGMLTNEPLCCALYHFSHSLFSRY